MDQGPGVGQSGAGGETKLRLCTLGAQSEADAEGGVQTGSRETPDRQGNRTVGDALFQGVQKPVGRDRAGARDRFVNARWSKGTRLLSGDDLCGFFGGREPGCLRQPGLPSPGTKSDIPAAPK